MGLNLKDLVVREKTTLESFASRIIAIDAYNALYATIRMMEHSLQIPKEPLQVI